VFARSFQAALLIAAQLYCSKLNTFAMDVRTLLSRLPVGAADHSDAEAAAFAVCAILLVIAAVTALEKAAHLSKETSRKFVHVAVGHYMFAAFATIADKRVAAAPLAVFVVLNAASLRTQLFATMETARPTLGTVYYPLSLAVLTMALYDTDKTAILVGTMALAWGDGMAAMVGAACGRHRYQPWAGKGARSLEGSAAMAAASFVAIYLVLTRFDGGAYPDGVAAAQAAAGLAVLAALTEGSAYGDTDNLAVPLLTAAAYHYARR
jgi:phytol kinase